MARQGLCQHALPVTVAVVATLAVAAWLTTPPRLEASAIPGPELPADLDAWLTASERAADREDGVVEGTEKRLLWREPGRRTHYAVVYLHGFSASRAELAPVPERIAAALDANLFETRLAGHGLRREALTGTRAEEWLADTIEAITIGSAIGEHVVVVGTSTGATLPLALAGHAVLDDVAALVLLSPNLGPRDTKAEWLTRPFGPLIARAVAGETRSWTPHNALQGRYWTTSYPITAAIEMMRIVDRARANLPATLAADVLFVVSPRDTVVSTAAARDAFAAIDAPRKRLVEFDGTSDPSRHVLAGDILSPASTDSIADLAVEFVTAANQGDRERP